MNAHELSTPVIEPDLRLVTLPEAVNYLADSRGALYSLLDSGQLASIRIGHRARRRVPMVQLQRCGRVRPCVTS